MDQETEKDGQVVRIGEPGPGLRAGLDATEKISAERRELRKELLHAEIDPAVLKFMVFVLIHSRNGPG